MILKRGRKAQANLLVVLILIILILILLIIAWNIISVFLKENSEIVDIKAKLINVKMNIDGVSKLPPEPSNPDELRINLTLHRGPERTILVNRTIVKKHAEIVFIIDSTGSMRDEIQDVKDTITNFADNLNGKNVSYRLALVEFKDYPELPCGGLTDFPYKIHQFNGQDFTTNVILYKDELSLIQSNGGDDAPESHLTAIEQASDNLNYKISNFPYMTLKFMIVLTDNKPHARDCICETANIWDCKESFDVKNNIWTNNTYMYNKTYACYKGPEYVEDIQQKILGKNITFFYINKNNITNPYENGLCKDDPMVKITSATGGSFYSYSEASGVSSIIDRLGDEIVDIFEAEQKWDHLKVVFYTNYGSFVQKQGQVPEPLETKTYTIMVPLEIKNTEDITKVEIYMAVYTSSGNEVISSLLDSFEL